MVKRRAFVATGTAIALGFLAGCTSDDNLTDGAANESQGTQDEGGAQDGEDATDDSEGYSGTGTDNYSGTWTSSQVSGTWEFTVDWEKGEITGSTSGGYVADISGSVSGGTIDAEGEAAMGTVSWSGSFSSDGTSVSGEWSGVGYTGTWSGSLSEEGETDGETEAETETPAPTDAAGELPPTDQVSGKEVLERYPGSVMLIHRKTTMEGEEATLITYGTEDSVQDVAAWYKEQLGDPIWEQTGDDGKILYFRLSADGSEFAQIAIAREDVTAINVYYGSQ